MIAGPAGASSLNKGLSLEGGLARLNGGEGTAFRFQSVLGVRFSSRLSDKWFFELAGHRLQQYDDSTYSGGFSIGRDEANATIIWKATRLTGALTRRMDISGDGLFALASIHTGLIIWKVVDVNADTLLKVRGSRNETLDFAATELIFGGSLGLGAPLSKNLSLRWRLGVDYLSGAGADFADGVNSSRDRLLTHAFFGFSFSFGKAGTSRPWRSEKSWASQPEPNMGSSRRAMADSDGDGVSDDNDRCDFTPRGAIVDGRGCPIDSDRDGVVDGLDHCPGTSPRAADRVDIYGCPVDSDFDGLADYLDACPNNIPGAIVDSRGCPVDSDADGVPDGLDDCPATLFGVDVDRYGCIDVSALSKPLVLNIDYSPGSFEVDPTNKKKITRLARLLNFVSDIKLEINGFTDNIGTVTANKKLSDKRAKRVRDFLVVQGVDSSRIRVIGRGEVHFVASNSTAKGRARNRRIEIVFYK